MTANRDLMEEIRGFLDGEVQRQSAGWSLSFAEVDEPVPAVELRMTREKLGMTLETRRRLGVALLEAEGRGALRLVRGEVETMRHCLVFGDPGVQAREAAS